jgi:hypothetical protein
MSSARSVLPAAAAVGLLALPASAETIATIDGHYYKLVPLKVIPRYSGEVVTVIPEAATASVPLASLSLNSSCRLTNFQKNILNIQPFAARRKKA